ncbi:MAG TPA: hypothetical protein VD994_18450, partial [Prosthecobacter sp.]|nr:hypothetical protein [Prosthecobacter sp.]
LAGGVFWIFEALLFGDAMPKAQPQAERPRPARPPEPAGPSQPPQAAPAPASTVYIDPALQEQADRLHAPETTPQEDLEILADFIQTYSKALAGNPVGENQDITAALTGYGGTRGRVFPPNHRTIVNGELVDRWGTPYWFHPNNGTQMEIRSAGPDRQLFNADDVVNGASPPGLGATPAAANAGP